MPSFDEIMKSGKSPGEMVRLLLERTGWTQDEFASIIGRSKRTVSDIVLGRSGITPEMAIALGAAFGNDPREWLLLEGQYRLSLAEGDTTEIEKRARLFKAAPIRDMERRGWIAGTDSLDDLQAALEGFFNGPIDGEITFPVAARRTVSLPSLAPAEVAWCFRARQLARNLLVNPFSEERIGRAHSALRRLAAHPKEARRIPQVLAEYGIRFVVVEPLPGVKIDGAAFWDDIGPVIALSLRYDRVDGFWFTLMHEFSHICNGDPISVDSGMVDAAQGVTVALAGDDMEDRANREAASFLIDSSEMDSFIRRVGPLYPRDRIIQFANRIKIHPGIIIGQLQYRKELGYMALRDLLVKIREHVVSTALTDGWGQSIAPSVLRVHSR